MILSQQQLFSENQDLSQAAGTYASTNIIDLGATGTPHGAAAALVRDIGKGEGIPLECIVTQTFTDGSGNSTLTVSVQVDTTSAFSTPTTVAVSPTWGVADLVAGKNLLPNLHVPVGVNQRYMRLLYTIAGETTDTGTVTAGISGGRQTNDPTES